MIYHDFPINIFFLWPSWMTRGMLVGILRSPTRVWGVLKDFYFHVDQGGWSAMTADAIGMLQSYPKHKPKPTSPICELLYSPCFWNVWGYPIFTRCCKTEEFKNVSSNNENMFIRWAKPITKDASIICTVMSYRKQLSIMFLVIHKPTTWDQYLLVQRDYESHVRPPIHVVCSCVRWILSSLDFFPSVRTSLLTSPLLSVPRCWFMLVHVDYSMIASFPFGEILFNQHQQQTSRITHQITVVTTANCPH